MQPQQEPIPVQSVIAESAHMKPKSASAEAGFVLSIIAFLLVLIGMAVSNALVFGFFGLATSIAALVCSIVGAVSCRATGVRRGMALAVTGVIISAIMLFLGFAETIMWLQQM